MNSKGNQMITDFEILKKIVNKELSFKDVDYETKIRLIKLCDNRINEINKKIKEYDRRIELFKMNAN